MKNTIYGFLLFNLTFFSFNINSAIRLVLGVAIVDSHSSYYEFRKNQYLESFNIINQLGYGDFYIIEACKKKGPTFLEEYCKNVFYALDNNPFLKNNGINESKTILEGLYHFNFDAEDIIIKFTGRYHFLSDYFLKIIEKNTEYDAFVKDAGDGHNIHTLCFAMRYKFLKEMYENIDYVAMEKNKINIEHELYKYINKKSKEAEISVFYVDKLDIRASYFGSTSQPGMSAQVLIH